MSPRRLARLAGLLYLGLIVSGAFAHLFVRAAVHVPDDAAATAANVAENAALFRLGFVVDIVMAVFFLFTGMTLYALLERVHANVARAMVLFVALGVALICGNLIHHFAALLIASDGAYTSALGAEGAAALVRLFLDVHRYGYLLGQLFFGLWLLPLGFLVYRSDMLPRVLGVLLVIGGGAHIADMFVVFLFPSFGEAISGYVRAPAGVAELALVSWLLVMGAKPPRAGLGSSDGVPA